MKKLMLMAMVAVMGLAMVSCNKNAKTNKEEGCQGESACCAEGKVCPLTGEWTIESVGENNAIEDVNKPALTIAEGVVSGQTGCNTFNGAVKCCPKSQRVQFGEMATTKMFCQESDEQEQAILDALNNAASFTLEEDVLTLLDADGASLMTLQKL